MKLLFSNPRPIFVRDSADMNAPLIIGAAAFLFRYRYFYNDLSGPHSGHRNQMYVVGGLIVGNPTIPARQLKLILNSHGDTSIGPISSTLHPILARR